MHCCMVAPELCGKILKARMVRRNHETCSDWQVGSLGVYSGIHLDFLKRFSYRICGYWRYDLRISKWTPRNIHETHQFQPAKTSVHPKVRHFTIFTKSLQSLYKVFTKSLQSLYKVFTKSLHPNSPCILCNGAVSPLVTKARIGSLPSWEW